MTDKPSFLERLAETPLILDGAMGTMIYQRGVFVNVCYDELCLKQPELILGIHREYVEAGVDVIETNSFGANRRKLAAYGLAGQVEAINRAAVDLARQAAEDRTYVAASVGPCLPLDEPIEPELLEPVREAFAEQIGILAEAGVDLVILETFDKVIELQAAAAAAKGLRLPVVASFTIRPDHAPVMGMRPEAVAARRLDADENVDVIGMNCGTGPAGMFELLPGVLSSTDKPVMIMPNAGGPKDIGGRMLHLTTPEYFTEYAKRYIEMGVRGVGGCCGTTPQHLRMAARAIKGLSGVKEHIEVASAPAAAEHAALAERAVPTGEKSRFGAKLAAGEPVTSVEILPPRTGAGLEAFLDKCRRCRAAGVDAVNIPDGPRATARLSVLISALAVHQQTGIEPIPHYCCRDRNLLGMQSDLLGGHAAGLANWLIITGDPPKLGDFPDATGVFDVDSIGLTQVIHGLNHGYDAAGKPIDPPTALLIGVGANPVAVEPQREMQRFFAKIDAGAEFAITQPIFDPDALLRFLDRAGEHHRTIPVVAGVYPLLSLRNAEFMNQHVPGVVVPDGVLERMGRCRTKADGVKMGIEIAREARERIADRVQGFQASAPLGKIDIALEVLAD